MTAIPFTRSEKLFIFFSMLAGFCIASEYAISRPASQALFITAFSSKAIPWVWLATVPLNLFVISLYNRFLPTIGPWRMIASIACTTVAINTACCFLLPYFPGLIFFHFAWKDIYILLMFKQLWSMIHATIPSKRAKYLYGLIFCMGTLGASLGSLVPAHLASLLGSERLFLCTLPLYLLVLAAYKNALHHSQVPKHVFLPSTPSFSEGFSLIRRNRFLIGILLLVVCMQGSVGLMEYQFSAHLELNILEKDLRTAYCGKLMGYMNILSAAFQILGGFVLVQGLGLRKSHLFVPALLLSSAIVSWIIPSFALISLSYVLLKAVDVSLFAILREMLYIPLSLDEKFRAKAVIDVFAYRSSKALIAFSLLSLQLIAGAYLVTLSSYLSIAVFLIWMAVAFTLFRKHAPASLI